MLVLCTCHDERRLRVGEVYHVRTAIECKRTLYHVYSFYRNIFVWRTSVCDVISLEFGKHKTAECGPLRFDIDIQSRRLRSRRVRLSMFDCTDTNTENIMVNIFNYKFLVPAFDVAFSGRYKTDGRRIIHGLPMLNTISTWWNSFNIRTRLEPGFSGRAKL
jgi:hypothetical protein